MTKQRIDRRNDRKWEDQKPGWDESLQLHKSPPKQESGLLVFFFFFSLSFCFFFPQHSESKTGLTSLETFVFLFYFKLLVLKQQ